MITNRAQVKRFSGKKVILEQVSLSQAAEEVMTHEAKEKEPKQVIRW